MKRLFLIRFHTIGLILVTATLLLQPFTVRAQGQGVSVSTTGVQPDPSAMLDISSSNAGILVPRMTRAQRDQVASPQSSLLIFQTDEIPG